MKKKDCVGEKNAVGLSLYEPKINIFPYALQSVIERSNQNTLVSHD